MKKMFFAALAATMMFASCNKEDINGSNESQEVGEATTMGLVFSLPTVDGARALGIDGTEVNATTSESTVSSITVFAFKADGTVAEGNNTRLDPNADFSLAGGFYTLNETSRIETTTATRMIYVVANYSAVADADVDTDAKLRALLATWNAAGQTWVIPATGMVMSTPRTPVSLVPQLVNEMPTASDNVITAKLERVSSKVVVTSTGSTLTFSQTLSQVDAVSPFSISYTLQSWATGLANTEANLIKQTVNGKLVTPNANRTGHPGAASDFVAVNLGSVASNWTLSAVNAKYVGENISANNKAGEVTYVMVRAKASPNQQAVINSSNNVEWVPANSDLNLGFWVVWNNTVGYEGMYFCKDEATADAVKAKLVGTNFTKLEYKGGLIYFMVSLNSDKSDKSVIHRNQFIHVDITGIADDVFIGMPGKGTDGTTPPDPDDPENPDPWNPEEPEDETTAYLRVSVNVSPWLYSGSSVELK